MTDALTRLEKEILVADDMSDRRISIVMKLIAVARAAEEVSGCSDFVADAFSQNAYIMKECGVCEGCKMTSALAALDTAIRKDTE